VVHPATRLTRYIYDELSFLYYPTPCGSVVDVKPMDKNASKTRDWYHLLPVFIGILLFVQAGSAKLEMDTNISPQNLWIGSTVTITTHIYDGDYSGFPIANGQVRLDIVRDGIPVQDAVVGTNATGWSVTTFLPPQTGRYSITPDASADYNNVPGLPHIGVQHKYGSKQWINVTNKSFIPVPTFTPVALITATTTTAPPVTATPTAQQTLPVTQVTQPTPVTLETQVTQAIPVQQTTSSIPASQSDTTPPVTTLTLAGTEDGSGGYRSEVTCTLSAADNANGSGVSVIQYSFDGASWNTYSQPFPVARTGPMVLYYRSSDNAGNTEVPQVKAITISGPVAAPAGTTMPAAAATQAGSGSSPPFWLITLIILIIIAIIGGALYLKSRTREEQKK
jgi:hypothetical protein